MRTNRENGGHGEPRLTTARQRGAILPFVAVGLLAIIGVAGLAIDSSHTFVNVTRLQNGVDAAALSAGRTLSLAGSTLASATEHGTEAFTEHLVGELAGDPLDLAFEYSVTLNPFTPGADPASRYVRARVTNLSIPVFLAQVLPGVGERFRIGATAVSGPIPLSNGGEVCDIAPVVMCGDPLDTTPTDGTLFGLRYGNDAPVQCLKLPTGPTGGGGTGTDGDDPKGGGSGGGGSGGGGTGGGGPKGGWNTTECGEEPAEDIIGPGNFLLARIACPGGNCVRNAFAGDSQSCLSDASFVPTEPGATVGPVRQGVNTRFNDYQGAGLNSTDHKPDLVITSPMSYAAYLTRYADEAYDPEVADIGVPNRRVMAVPIVNCAGSNTGQSDLPLLGFGCYFLNEKIENGGPNSVVKGQLVEGCETGGTPGENPVDVGPGTGPYEIILYNDPDEVGS